MRALRWITHPVTVVATVVLYLNDHVFKQAWPGPVTGKLSDVAGMVMFPALLGALAGLVGVPLRVSRWAAPLVAAAGFAWVKATAVGAAVTSAAWSGVVLRDPSDLVALPAVVLAWWTAGRVEQAPPVADAVARRVRLFTALGFALVATAATSAPPVPDAALLVEETSGGVTVSGTFGSVFSADLVTWTDLSVPGVGDRREVDDRIADAAKAADPEGCDPADGRHCYRVRARVSGWSGGRGEVPLGGAVLGVEETVDGGASWAMAWEIPASRWEFLAVRHQLYVRRDAGLMASADLLVRAVPGGHQVIVANGVEGLAVRDPDGSWRRVAIFVAGPRGLSIDPLATTAFGAGTGLPGSVGVNLALVAAIAGGAVIAVRAGTRRRSVSVIAWPLVLVPVLMLCGGYGTFTEGDVTPLLAVALPIAGLVAVLCQRVLPRPRALAVFGSVLLVAAAYTAPFFGWSVAVPESRDDAELIGLIAAGVAGAGAIAVAWWAAAKPLPRRTLAQLYHPQRWTPPAAPGPRGPRGPGQG